MNNSHTENLSARCPFCYGTKCERFTAVAADLNGKGTINIVECRNCELAWQWPLRRSESDSVAYFQQEYDNKSGYFDAEATAQRCRLQLEFVDACAEVGRLLDIGSGSGAFVKSAAAAGWDATGLEPAGTPFEEGRAKLVRGTVDDLAPSDVFDVATLLDVVEHVPDYVSLLGAVARHVRPGGSIVIETGNYQSLNRTRSGATWWDFQADHRWYLAPDIIRRQLSELGFGSFKLCERVLRPHWKSGGEQPARLHQVLPGIVRRPWLAAERIARYRSERAAASRWPGWYHVAIFAIAGVKSA